MPRRMLRLCALVALSAGMIAVGAVVGGCGGIDCAETATCLETTDRDSAIDQSVEETSIETGSSRDGGDSAAPDGGDATIDGDSGRDADASPELDGDAADSADVRDAIDAGDANDGCAATREDCTNGKDDNCNGLVDCADPDCAQQQFSCVPAWPTGWTAPVAFYDNDSGPLAPLPLNCTAPYGTDLADGHDTPVALPAQCGCTCGAVEGTTCTSPFATLFIGSQSCAAPAAFASSVGSACGQLSPQGGINSAEMIDAGVPSGGSCAPQPSASVPAWNPSTGWAATERVCSLPTAHAYVAAPQNGCDAGQFCAEMPATTFNGGKACLYVSGQAGACPAGYTARTTFFDAGVDTRSCSGSCTCGGAAGAKCSSRVTLLAGGCDGGSPMVLADTSCLPLSNYGGSAVSASATQTITGGSCPVTSTPVADGGVVPTGQSTVCCPP